MILLDRFTDADSAFTGQVGWLGCSMTAKSLDLLQMLSGAVQAHHCGRARSAADHGEYAHGGGFRRGQGPGQEVCLPLLPS